MLNHPAVLLADEPTGNLDHDNAAVFLAALREHAADGHVVIMATHNAHAAAAAGRVLCLRNGMLE